MNVADATATDLTGMDPTATALQPNKPGQSAFDPNSPALSAPATDGGTNPNTVPTAGGANPDPLAFSNLGGIAPVGSTANAGAYQAPPTNVAFAGASAPTYGAPAATIAAPAPTPAPASTLKPTDPGYFDPGGPGYGITPTSIAGAGSVLASAPAPGASYSPSTSSGGNVTINGQVVSAANLPAGYGLTPEAQQRLAAGYDVSLSPGGGATYMQTPAVNAQGLNSVGAVGNAASPTGITSFNSNDPQSMAAAEAAGLPTPTAPSAAQTAAAQANAAGYANVAAPTGAMAGIAPPPAPVAQISTSNPAGGAPNGTFYTQPDGTVIDQYGNPISGSPTAWGTTFGINTSDPTAAANQAGVLAQNGISGVSTPGQSPTSPDTQTTPTQSAANQAALAGATGTSPTIDTSHADSEALRIWVAATVAAERPLTPSRTGWECRTDGCRGYRHPPPPRLARSPPTLAWDRVSPAPLRPRPRTVSSTRPSGRRNSTTRSRSPKISSTRSSRPTLRRFRRVCGMPCRSAAAAGGLGFRPIQHDAWVISPTSAISSFQPKNRLC